MYRIEGVDRLNPVEHTTVTDRIAHLLDRVDVDYYGAVTPLKQLANVATTDRQRRLNIAFPGSMRGPGHAQGNFALESAIDELAYELEDAQPERFVGPLRLTEPLRRQVQQTAERPLIVMTPKSLLRHPQAVSTLDQR